MCLYPKLIKNRKYTANKKNGGNIPPIEDDRVKYVPIGCQNCVECRKQKCRQWQVRLLEDIKHNTNGKFVTFTFSDESIKKIVEIIREEETEWINKSKGYELDNKIATIAVKLFLGRWRKKFKTSLRHWLVTELGHNGTQNIHLHGIIWTNEPLEVVEQKWEYGFIWKGKETNGKLINYVNERTVGYITKYVSKMDVEHKTYKAKILTSPGIGSGYTKHETGDWTRNKYNGEKTREYYKTRTGHEINMPVYWRNKIYSEKERELLWLQRLDKEIRWVRGEKVSVKEGYDEYDKLVEYYRKRNIELGYGTDVKNEEQENYERERRILMQKTRIMKAHKNELHKIRQAQMD